MSFLDFSINKNMGTCKKRKLENSNLNSCANVTGSSGHNFTNLCKTTTVKDDEVLQKYNDVAVKGLNVILFYFIITCFLFFFSGFFLNI